MIQGISVWKTLKIIPRSGMRKLVQLYHDTTEYSLLRFETSTVNIKEVMKGAKVRRVRHRWYMNYVPSKPYIPAKKLLWLEILCPYGVDQFFNVANEPSRSMIVIFSLTKLNDIHMWSQQQTTYNTLGNLQTIMDLKPTGRTLSKVCSRIILTLTFPKLWQNLHVVVRYLVISIDLIHTSFKLNISIGTATFWLIEKYNSKIRHARNNKNERTKQLISKFIYDQVNFRSVLLSKLRF